MAKPIVVKITGDASGFKKALNGATGMLGKFTSAVGTSIQAGAVAATAAVAGGVKAFADFDTQMREVLTLLPDAGMETFDQLGDQVKDFSKEFGALPNEVIPSLYQALSAGVPQDNVFEFLETAQKAAKGGVTDLETAVDGISSVVNAYGDDVISAAEASDLMFTSVRLGKTNFEELSSSLFQVAPIAASMGVEFNSVTGALANLTAQGVPTRQASTQMKAALAELGKEGTKADKAFQDLTGVGFTQFLAEGGTMTDAFIALSEGAEASDKSVLDLFSSIEAGQAVLALTADGGVALTDTMGEMAASAGATEAAFEVMDASMGSSFDRIKANLAVTGIELGERLAPTIEKVTNFILENFDEISAFASGVKSTLAPVFSALVEGATYAVGWIRDNWPTIRQVVETVMEKVGAAIDVARDIIGRLIDFVVDNKETFLGVFEAIKKTVSAVFEVVGNVVTFFVDLFKSNTESVDGEASKFMEIFQKVKEYVLLIFEAIKVAIETALAVVMFIWRNFGDEFLGAVKIVFDFFVEAFSAALDIVTGVLDVFIGLFTGDWGRLWDGLKSIVTGAFKLIGEAIQLGFQALGAVLDIAWEVFKKPFVALWNSLTEPIKNLWGDIKSLFVSGFDGLKNIINILKDSVVKVFSSVWDGVKNAAKSAFNFIADAWNNTIGRLTFRIPSWVPGLGGKGWDVPDIPRFATGGIMSRDGLAMVGERGPELVALPQGARVTPAHATANNMKGAVINVTANTNADPYMIAREVSWALITQGG